MTNIVDPVDRWLVDNPTARRDGRWADMPDWMLADPETRLRLGVPDHIPYPMNPRTAAPTALYAGLFGVTGENGAPGVAVGPCHTDDCTGLHWTGDDAEYHLFGDRTMQAVDPAEWLSRHPEAFRDAHVPVPKTVLAFLQAQQPPMPPPARCTDPDCPDYGKAVARDHPRADGMPTGDEPAEVDADEFGYHDQPDDPWVGRPVARGTFRQRWLLGPKFITRRPIPRSDYYELVVMVNLRSWMFGFESWHAGGGSLQIGPVQINVSEPPF